MLTILQQLLGMSDPEDLCLLDAELFKNFPLCVMWKNKESVYLGGNDYLAKSLGLSKGDDIKNCTDFDLSWASSADNFRENDKQVIYHNQPKAIIEVGDLINENAARAISYKFPLRLRSKKVAGVICVAIKFDQDDLFPMPLTDHHFKSTFTTLNAFASCKLTKRQKECVYYLTRGMSIKQIANRLTLSPRTVEHYLEAAKDKLGCHSRAQLIAKVLDE